MDWRDLVWLGVLAYLTVGILSAWAFTFTPRYESGLRTLTGSQRAVLLGVIALLWLPIVVAVSLENAGDDLMVGEPHEEEDTSI